MSTTDKRDFRLVWPRSLVTVATTRVRIGRALHWLGLGIGAAFIAYGAYMMAAVLPGVIGVLKLISATCYGIGATIMGRLARMILSGE